ncbi:EamA family transporter [Staphylococcus capitis]|uniref:DMT family transporter n=1 Tax=Staphylococcus capitis TaxID=29388 RepID=UPI002874EB01|nr:EamA family transporter [Staphylococcus capitis]MDS0999504.1 EamA family transporter [Staphylococcus capitis]
MKGYKQSRLKGILFAIIGASLWGLGGTVSDFLFKHAGINVDWYVTTRLIISGLFLLVMFKIMNSRQSIFVIFTRVSQVITLIIYSLFGMLIVQYAYMASINEGNAAVATLLQYIAPVYIILWFAFRGKEKLRAFDIVVVLLTLVGTFLLLTNGSLSKLIVAPSSLFWGILAGLALAFYTIYAEKLLNKYASILVVGWAMIISGIIMTLRHPIWNVSMTQWHVSTFLYLIFGIIGGTALAYYLFIDSLKYLSAKETTLFGTIEPVVAVVASGLFLGVSFKAFQILGIIIIVVLILVLSLKKQPNIDN